MLFGRQVNLTSRPSPQSSSSFCGSSTISSGPWKAGAKLGFSTPPNYNTGLVNLEGSLRINGGEDVQVDNFVLFSNDGSEFSVEALEDSKYFILSGEPLNEPIASYGPFVMNTMGEIQQAMLDFNSGKFGHLD